MWHVCMVDMFNPQGVPASLVVLEERLKDVVCSQRRQWGGEGGGE